MNLIIHGVLHATHEEIAMGAHPKKVRPHDDHLLSKAIEDLIRSLKDTSARSKESTELLRRISAQLKAMQGKFKDGK
jgi:hypothetical protein